MALRGHVVGWFGKEKGRRELPDGLWALLAFRWLV
jgi:hypothetical protein